MYAVHGPNQVVQIGGRPNTPLSNRGSTAPDRLGIADRYGWGLARLIGFALIWQLKPGLVLPGQYVLVAGTDLYYSALKYRPTSLLNDEWSRCTTIKLTISVMSFAVFVCGAGRGV